MAVKRKSSTKIYNFHGAVKLRANSWRTFQISRKKKLGENGYTMSKNGLHGLLFLTDREGMEG